MRTRAIVAAAALMGMTVGLAHAQTTDESTASTAAAPARATTPGLIVVNPGAQAATLGSLTSAQTATPTPAAAQNTPAARAAANNTKMQQASTPSTTPGTAYDQGLSDTNSAAAAAAALDNYNEMNSARQKGIQVQIPRPSNPVASQPALRGWFANWKDVLSDAGVDDRTINFEASRLNEDEFARWASRLVRVSNPDLNEVVAAPVGATCPPTDASPD